MARAVLSTPAALQSLRRARQWLTQPGSGETGRARWQALRDARRALRINPYLGAQLDAFGTRQFVVSEHRILYRISSDTGQTATAGDILILAVFGPGQP